eukprot:jgi/Botrbrau1/19922/Bobra.0059s0039.1
MFVMAKFKHVNVPTTCTHNSPPIYRHAERHVTDLLHSAMTRKALVYAGDGAGSRSVASTIRSLKRALPNIVVERILPEDVLESQWQEDCILFVMPGGADLPYCRRLNGKGNSLIREYVENGGAYLGLCAGAYYACARVEFEVGDSRLEVVGERELRFFSGIARGSVYSGLPLQK